MDQGTNAYANTDSGLEPQKPKHVFSPLPNLEVQNIGRKGVGEWGIRDPENVSKEHKEAMERQEERDRKAVGITE